MDNPRMDETALRIVQAGLADALGVPASTLDIGVEDQLVILPAWDAWRLLLLNKLLGAELDTLHQMTPEPWNSDDDNILRGDFQFRRRP